MDTGRFTALSANAFSVLLNLFFFMDTGSLLFVFLGLLALLCFMLLMVVD